MKAMTDVYDKADDSFPGRHTDAPLEGGTVEQIKETMEQEQKELHDSLKVAHEGHVLAPLEFDYFLMPKYYTHDVTRHLIYYHEYLLMKMAENSNYSESHPPSEEQRKEWADEWTNEKTWTKATRHLNRVVQMSCPFYKVRSPEFRSWHQTEG